MLNHRLLLGDLGALATLHVNSFVGSDWIGHWDGTDSGLDRLLAMQKQEESLNGAVPILRQIDDTDDSRAPLLADLAQRLGEDGLPRADLLVITGRARALRWLCDGGHLPLDAPFHGGGQGPRGGRMWERLPDRMRSTAPWALQAAGPGATVRDALLALAAGCGAVRVPAWLSEGARPERAMLQGGRTLLHVAAARGSVLAGQWLACNGCGCLGTALSDTDGLAPVHEAAVEGRASMVEFLAECGLTCADARGRGWAWHALRSEHRATVALGQREAQDELARGLAALIRRGGSVEEVLAALEAAGGFLRGEGLYSLGEEDEGLLGLLAEEGRVDVLRALHAHLRFFSSRRCDDTGAGLPVRLQALADRRGHGGALRQLREEMTAALAVQADCNQRMRSVSHMVSRGATAADLAAAADAQRAAILSVSLDLRPTLGPVDLSRWIDPGAAPPAGSLPAGPMVFIGGPDLLGQVAGSANLDVLRWLLPRRLAADGCRPGELLRALLREALSFPSRVTARGGGAPPRWPAR